MSIILHNSSILLLLLLLLLLRRRLPVLLYLTDTEQNISWHVNFCDTVYSWIYQSYVQSIVGPVFLLLPLTMDFCLCSATYRDANNLSTVQETQLTWALPRPWSRSRVTSEWRSNSLCATRTSASAYDTIMSVLTVFITCNLKDSVLYRYRLEVKLKRLHDLLESLICCSLHAAVREKHDDKST